MGLLYKTGLFACLFIIFIGVMTNYSHGDSTQEVVVKSEGRITLHYLNGNQTILIGVILSLVIVAIAIYNKRKQK